MMAGELLQVGRPERLYRDQQDLRVAEMIGSPKINVVSRAHWISLGASLPPGIHGNTTHLAFRPEAVGIAASGMEDSMASSQASRISAPISS